MNSISKPPAAPGADVTMNLAAIAHPDAALLAACAEIIALQGALDDGAAPEGYAARADELMRQIITMTAATVQGCRARVQAIAGRQPEIWDQTYGAKKSETDKVFWADYGRLPKEETSQIYRDRQAARWAAKHEPKLAPGEVVKRAIAAANDRAADLFMALEILENLGGDQGAEVSRGMLDWLAAKLKADANEIQTDLDHAQAALGGKPYPDARTRYKAAGGEA